MKHLAFPVHWTVLLLCSLLPACAQRPPSPPLTRIAFASCLRQDRPAPILDTIADTKPDLFVFLGDNIYADTTTMPVMRAKYDKLAAIPGYQRLKAACPILATWDDHDYGADDAGREYPMRKESQREFLRFFDEPKDSPRWRRPGVYDAYTFGPPGKRVQIIVLDTRYFRSPLTKRPRPATMQTRYLPDDSPSATILGHDQWLWLEKQLKQPADIRIIASSIQALPQGPRGESWNNFPHERDRLLNLVGQATAQHIVFITGDVHYADLSRLEYSPQRTLYEVCSSSLNQGWKQITATRPAPLPNRHRVGDYFSDDNFGVIEIDWSATPPKLKLQIRDRQNQPVLQQAIESR